MSRLGVEERAAWGAARQSNSLCLRDRELGVPSLASQPLVEGRGENHTEILNYAVKLKIMCVRPMLS